MYNAFYYSSFALEKQGIMRFNACGMIFQCRSLAFTKNLPLNNQQCFYSKQLDMCPFYKLQIAKLIAGNEAQRVCFNGCYMTVLGSDTYDF